MSRNHSASANDAAHVVSEMQGLDEDQAFDKFGVQLFEDGSIFDPIYQMKFETVGEWANFSVEQDNMESEEHFSQGGQYDGL